MPRHLLPIQTEVEIFNEQVDIPSAQANLAWLIATKILAQIEARQRETDTEAANFQGDTLPKVLATDEQEGK